MGARDELTTCRAAVGASVAHTSRNEVSEGMLLPAAPPFQCALSARIGPVW